MGTRANPGMGTSAAQLLKVWSGDHALVKGCLLYFPGQVVSNFLDLHFYIHIREAL